MRRIRRSYFFNFDSTLNKSVVMIYMMALNTEQIYISRWYCFLFSNSQFILYLILYKTFNGPSEFRTHNLCISSRRSLYWGCVGCVCVCTVLLLILTRTYQVFTPKNISFILKGNYNQQIYTKNIFENDEKYKSIKIRWFFFR